MDLINFVHEFFGISHQAQCAGAWNPTSEEWGHMTREQKHRYFIGMDHDDVMGLDKLRKEVKKTGG